MASITIRNLDDEVKGALQIRAAKNRRSMSEEVRQILRAAVSATNVTENLDDAIHRRFSVFGGFELDLPKREATPDPPRFD